MEVSTYGRRSRAGRRYSADAGTILGAALSGGTENDGISSGSIDGKNIDSGNEPSNDVTNDTGTDAGNSVSSGYGSDELGGSVSDSERSVQSSGRLEDTSSTSNRRTGSSGRLGNRSDSSDTRPRSGTLNGFRTGTTESSEETPLVVVTQRTPRTTSTKPTDVRSKRQSTKAGDIDASEMLAVIVGFFGLLSTFAGDHWMVEEDEAEQLAKPLSRILNKMNKKKKDSVNDLMSPALLITAVGAIVIPRLLITLSTLKEKSKHERIKQQRLAETARRDSGNSPDVSREIPAEVAGSREADREGFQSSGGNGDSHGDTVPPEVIRQLIGND